ncbi:gag-pol polyprotein, partial [Tanacetum coccineum]
NIRKTSPNTRNQAYVQEGRIDVQNKGVGRNVGSSVNASRNIGYDANVPRAVGNSGSSSRVVGNAPRVVGNATRVTGSNNVNVGNTQNVKCYNCNGRGYYAKECPQPRVGDSNYFKEQILLAKNDEAGIALTEKENDFFADIMFDEEQ